MLDPHNPFATQSSLPYGLPDFAAITPDHYREAFTQGMADAIAELDAIAANPEPPTVENTLDAWERSGQPFLRAANSFYAVKAADTTDELDALDEEFSPKFAQFMDAVVLNKPLYRRLVALKERADAGEVELDAEASWLLTDRLADFRRNGVALEGADEERLRAINTRLAELSTAYEKAMLAGRNAGTIVVTDVAELDGLSDEEIAGLKREDGTYAIELVNTTQQPLTESLKNRALRKRIFEASTHRGLDAGECDTRGYIVEEARLRAEKATLLGYDNFVAMVTDGACAKTSEAVRAMLTSLAPKALAKAKEDEVELAARFAELYPGETFEACDWAYMAELVRAEKFALDPEDFKPYLTPEKVLSEVYAAAGQLYGFTFTRRPELRGHTVDAEVYEVADENGTLGLFVMDFWARPTKLGGAWMNNLQDQSTLLGTVPIVTNNCNYTRGQSTISWDGVITMFHEFGHALHGLMADTRYVSHSGTATPADFVEFPSQVNEHWAWTPDRVLPAELARKVEESQKFNLGFSNFEAWSAMLLDYVWHTTPLDALPTSADEVEDFERRALESYGIAYDLVPPRYRTAYFSHIWTVGYSGAYYSYVWAEVMDADAVDWFETNGGGTRENGEYFRRHLLAPGGSVDVMETWRDFRGRDPEIGPLLVRAGIAD